MTEAKPFYKCAGGKSKLVETIMSHAPMYTEFDTYIEPFFGGGAIFFGLYNAGWLDGKRVILADADRSLIDVLRYVVSYPEALHESLVMLKRGYDAADPDLRRGLYNDTRAQWNHGVRTPAANLFLKGLSFNGLWRMSKQGHMNAPWGKYESFHIPELATLKHVQRALKNATLIAGDFRQALAQLGDETTRCLMYVDPPYDGGFVAYTENGFTSQDQADLIMQCSLFTAGGGHVIYSNANTESINGMLREYWPDGQIHHVLGKRSIAASGDRRGDAREVLVVGGPEV